jgi:hypothetical protein
MAVVADIVRTWRGPRRVMRDLLAMGQREDRAIAYLLAACLLIFVAQWPRLARAAQGFDLPPGQEVPPLDRLVAYEFVSWLMIWPLFFYVIAALSHLVARVFGGAGTWYGARLALFWSLLATVPLALLHGVLVGFTGAGSAANAAGALWLISLAAIWSLCLREAERG